LLWVFLAFLAPSAYPFAFEVVALAIY
jgi:hypothetical protein